MPFALFWTRYIIFTESLLQWDLQNYTYIELFTVQFIYFIVCLIYSTNSTDECNLSEAVDESEDYVIVDVVNPKMKHFERASERC
jgi:hypothetical protein